MPLWLKLMLLGWLVSLLAGLRFGARTDWKRGLLLFCVAFAGVLFFVRQPADEAPPVPSRQQQVPTAPQRFGVVDFQSLIAAHPTMQQRALALTNQAATSRIEREQLIKRGDSQAVLDFDRKTRAKLGEEHRVARDVALSELRHRIAQLARQERLDAVFDSSNPVYPLPLVGDAAGWTNLTEVLLRELKP